jgi:hypothetical protein
MAGQVRELTQNRTKIIRRRKRKKSHPITGHEGKEGGVGKALLFL